ncbi:MAG: hypothetical protein JEY99_00665 [Spirochaetales bacterium]|nr:hypothetical protein [Spirochaetales bacterium]
MEVYRSTECPSCGRDAKVCKNCVFYSPNSHWECREHVPEAVMDKEKANFCGFFNLKKDGEAGEDSGQDDALDDFNQLFK